MGGLAIGQQPPPPEPPPQQEEPGPTEEKAPAPPPPAEMPAEKPAGQPGGPHGSWSDIVVVPRKAVLKAHRLELAPMVGLTINDPLIRHWALGGQMNYFLTDVFGVGLEGQYFKRDITSRGNLIGLQYYRVPTMNELRWAAALNFTYVPIYGKFAFFNRGIVHWEAMAIGGVGLTHTQIIPRNPADAVFDNFNITPNLGIGGRVFLSQWLTVWFNIRDYIMPDKFESQMRPAGQIADDAKAQADTQIVNNVVFALGASFFLPMGFRYHTPR